MTSKALLGLVGGGSAAAGLGAGYGAGTKTKFPYKYVDLMNTLYSTLISKAERENNAYKNMDDTAQSNFLYAYTGEICGISKDFNIDYKTEKEKQRAEADKTLCEETNAYYKFNDKSKWVTHLQNRPQKLKEEWAEFKKYIYDKSTTSSQ